MGGAAEADPKRKADGRESIGRESRTGICLALFRAPSCQAYGPSHSFQG